MKRLRQITLNEIIYDDEGVGKRGDFDPAIIKRMDPHKHYEKHLGNLFTLQHIQKNSKDTRERIQAEKEMGKARSKMDFWSKHPNFDQKRKQEIMSATKKKWNR
jgi:hypothetical protein